MSRDINNQALYYSPDMKKIEHEGKCAHSVKLTDKDYL